MRVSAIPNTGALPGLEATKPGGSTAATGGFAQFLQGQLGEINQHQVQADQAIQQLATGESNNVHDVVLSMAQADLSFRLVLEIRNRLVESYQEIMRMQV